MTAAKARLPTTRCTFQPGRQFVSAESLILQTVYAVSKSFRIYGEVGVSSADQGPFGDGVHGGHMSVLVGPDWETAKLTLRGNYVSQVASYFPVLGYFAGDRRGPYAELRYRFNSRVEVTASADHYTNNLAHDPSLPDFGTTGYSAGVSLRLPFKFSLSSNLSIIHFSSLTPVTGQREDSNNRQLILTVTRPVRRHNLRVTYMNLDLNSNVSPQKQWSVEVEDTFSWKRIVLGSAIRTQNSTSTESRNTLFYRGSAQVNLRRVSAYGYVEIGNDLVNRTIFATNSYSSTVVGMSAPLFHGWNLQVEAFRNNLNTALNPENVFVLQSQGIGVSNALSAFNQWSVYFRLVKQIHWGGQFPTEGIERYAEVHSPLVGMVIGFVSELRLAGNRGVAGVPVSLDGSRVARTNETGQYRFIEVPEGSHHITFANQELPAEFEPGGVTEALVKVQPHDIARVDLEVVRLTSLSGKISAPQGFPSDGAVVRLLPTDRYTTPDADGSFTFYNLREGDYEVVLDSTTLPDGCEIASPARVPVSVRLDAPAVAVQFEIRAMKVEKPVRKILDQAIELPDKGKTPSTGAGHGGGGHGGGGHGGGGGSRQSHRNQP